MGKVMGVVQGKVDMVKDKAWDKWQESVWSTGMGTVR